MTPSKAHDLTECRPGLAKAAPRGAYAITRFLPVCIACGAELPDDGEADDPAGVACDSCYAESEAKAAAQRERERADQFQWQSLDWFKMSIYERLPFGGEALLMDSVAARIWLGRARTQLGSATYWAEQGDRMDYVLASLRTLADQIDAADRALSESPSADSRAPQTG